MDLDTSGVHNKTSKKEDGVLRLMGMIKYDKNEAPITSLQLKLF